VCLILYSAVYGWTQPQKGQSYPVAEWRWIDIVNPTPVTQQYSNATRPLSADDTCGIQEKGTVTVLASEDGTALVRYTAPGPQMGTPCPSGVMFLIPQSELETWPAQTAARETAEQQKKAPINRLLQQR
jgi:hypothetical protein